MGVELDVVLIRGAPGAGKSTLGRRLRKVLTAAAVVEVDDLRAMLTQVDWTSRCHHDQALAGAFALVGGFLRAGLRPIVLIDTLSRSRHAQVRAWLEREGHRYHSISLWVEPSTLRARLEQRESGFREWEPSAVLNAEVLDTRWPHETLIDVSALGPDAVAELVLRHLTALPREQGVGS
jgi:adenylate kinase family enzyme